ncbi:MAG: penicillin-binding protein 2 [Bacteroidota bacterium]|nr:penicillin-binding protein 2 [Bacteroidota bacterium]
MNIRRNIIILLVLFTGVVFIIQLYRIQVLETKYKLSAENNTFRHIPQHPARGVIYDREGRVVVGNGPIYNLKVYPNKLSPFDTTGFLKITGLTKKELKQILSGGKRFKSVTLLKEISQKNYAELQEFLYRFPDFYVEKKALRIYPIPTAAHILGYIGETNDDDIENDNYYRLGDYIGKSGVEKNYEKYLRGKKGVKIFLADSKNRIQASYADGKYDTTAIAGKDIVLSIDVELQKYGEDLMKNKIGGIVAIEPSTGEILALVSSPSYDPSLFVGKKLRENFNKVAQAKNKPLYNRAIKSRYPPGSTFKPINALIALEKKVITEKTVFVVNGYWAGSHYVGDHVFGAVDLVKSIQLSSNAYYCHVFGRILNNKEFESIDDAYNDWKSAVQSFGMGVKLGTDLSYEDKGLIYPSTYFDKYYGKGHWSHNTLISLAFGQGELGFTPLQLANAAAVIANEGYYYKPHIVKGISGDEIDPQYQIRYYSAIGSEHFPVVKEAMEKVVSAGTARRAYLKHIEICGKTGTAQNPHGDDHSIFMAFAPKDNPKIAIAVYVENAGYGSTWAAPISSLMIEKYLTDSISNTWREGRILKGDLIKDDK